MTYTQSLFSRIVFALTACAMLVVGAGPAHAGPEDDALALLLRADNVQAIGIGPHSIFVSWTDRAIAETYYSVQVSESEDGDYREVGIRDCSGTVPGTPVRTPQFDQTCATEIQIGPDADPNPIWVRVVPIVAVGSVPLLSGIPSTPDPALRGPLPPTNLACNGGGDEACKRVNSITLTWNDNSDEAYFWIMRARGSATADFGTKPHATVPANTTSYSEYIDEYGGQILYYRVVAVREQNIARLDETVVVERSFSNSLTSSGLLLDRVKVETAPVPPPSDPTGLSAVFIPPSTAELTWTDQFNGNTTLGYIDEDGWFIDYGPIGAGFEFTTSKMPNPGQGTVTFADTRVPPDTQRCYRVRGWRNGPAYSGFTNTACIGSTPTTPTGLIATAVDNSTVNLAWNDTSTSEESFVIERCSGVCNSGSTWTQKGEVDDNVTTFTDTTTVSSTTYSYRVFAVNSSGRSKASNIALVTTPVAPLAAPLDLSANGIGSHEIELTWTDVTTNETGFRVEYKNFEGEWAQLVVVGPNSGTGVVTYIDEDSLAAEETRCYRVRTIKVAKSSDPSNKACATTRAAEGPNGAPTGLSGTALDNYRINLTWTDNATNETGFRVEAVSFPNQACSPSITGATFKEIATAPIHPATGAANYTVTGLIPHTAYYFKLFAINKDGESAPAGPSACVQTLGPALPKFLDPSGDNDVEATRCKVDVEAPAATVERVLLIVNAYVPQTNVGHADYLWIEDPLTATDVWRKSYEFRRGVVYGLRAQAYEVGTNYASGFAGVRDIKVLADCPVRPDPAP